MGRDGEVGGDCRYPVSRFYARLGLSGNTERLQGLTEGKQTGTRMRGKQSAAGERERRTFSMESFRGAWRG